MSLIQAMVKHTSGNGRVVVKNSLSLNVTKAPESVLDKKDLMSDKLILITGAVNDKFYFVTGDKMLIKKLDGSNLMSSVIKITKTGWFTYGEFSPTNMKDDYSYAYYIEPVEYNGDRYYGGNAIQLNRISSIKFCSRFIHCGSPLVPTDIFDQSSLITMWGEVDTNGIHTLKIPSHLEDMSGLFDNAMSIDRLIFTDTISVPKIITLGQPKKMHRTFYSAFSYGTINYEVPTGRVVFGEMDVSKVTDFSYCFGQCLRANPDVELWNTVSADNMDFMFGVVDGWTTDKWSRDLSLWCVPLIPIEPVGFAQHHPMTSAQKPVWGTCPINTHMVASD